MLRKVFVDVDVHFDSDGKMTPKSITWKDETVYKIDRVTDVRRAASLMAGGMGMRYTVMINGQTSFLFYEDPRWFVEAKN